MRPGIAILLLFLGMQAIQASFTRTSQLSSSTGTLLAQEDESTHGLKRWTTYWNGTTALTFKTEITPPSGSYVQERASTGAQVGKTTYTYDAHGRPYVVTDAEREHVLRV